MKRGIAKLEETFGQTPRGNRSPPFALGPNTADLLEEFGFAYDSSLFGHDEPYRPRVPTVTGRLRDFVELPVSWELDDAPYFLFSFFPYMSGFCTPSQVLEIWKAEFDGSYRAGGCFLLVVHPFCIGRHPRIAMLDELITLHQELPGRVDRAPPRRRGGVEADAGRGRYVGRDRGAERGSLTETPPTRPGPTAVCRRLSGRRRNLRTR